MPVTQGIIDLALHPAFGTLTNLEDGYGPYLGDNTLRVWNDGGVERDVSATFGMLVILTGVLPPEMGYTFGAGFGGDSVFDGNRFYDRVCQVVVQHQLLFGFGGWITTQIAELHYAANLIMWDVAYPGG